MDELILCSWTLLFIKRKDEPRSVKSRLMGRKQLEQINTLHFRKLRNIYARQAPQSKPMEDNYLQQSNQQGWNLFLSKREDAYFNTRVSRYSPRYPFLQRRTNSFEKVQSRYNWKKKLLIDEELTHTKTMIDQNKAMIVFFFGKSQPPKQYAQTNNLQSQAEYQYKHTLNYLRNHSWMVQKQKRNYSQPKYRPILSHNGLPKKRQYQFNSRKQGHYFLEHWQDLEERIIRYKSLKTSTLISLQKKNKTQDFLDTCNWLWRIIMQSLKVVQKHAESDIFSQKQMNKSLYSFHKFLQHEHLCLINSLFPKEKIYRCRGMDEKDVIKLRITELTKIAEQIGIKVQNDSQLDINKIYYNFKALNRGTYYYDKRILLKKVFKISEVKSAGAVGEKRYSLEYCIGLHKIFDEKELQNVHPQQLQSYLMIQ